jgi:sugar-specific transcriptional regulator TrmB
MIADTLAKIGLTDYETEVYLTLVEYGRLNAKDISKFSKVPVTAVYPNLKSLIGKGLVQRIEGDVSYYISQEIRSSLNTYIKKRVNELDELNKKATLQLDAIKRRKQIVKEPEIVDAVIGGEASSQLILRMISDTRKTLYILGWRFSTTKNMYNILGKLKASMKKGADVRLIITKKGKCYDKLMPLYRDAGVEIRHYPIGDFSIMIRDSEECKLGVKSPDLADRVSVNVRNPDMAKAFQQYFLTIWKQSKKNLDG